MTRYHGEHPPHSTCLDVGAMHQMPGTEWVCGSECLMPGAPAPLVTTYEEWRVTGTPKLKAWESTYRREDEARAFMANATAIVPWTDGPHLHKRTVTVTEWTEVDA